MHRFKALIALLPPRCLGVQHASLEVRHSFRGCHTRAQHPASAQTNGNRLITVTAERQAESTSYTGSGSFNFVSFKLTVDNVGGNVVNNISVRASRVCSRLCLRHRPQRWPPARCWRRTTAPPASPARPARRQRGELHRRPAAQSRPGRLVGDLPGVVRQPHPHGQSGLPGRSQPAMGSLLLRREQRRAHRRRRGHRRTSHVDRTLRPADQRVQERRAAGRRPRSAPDR